MANKKKIRNIILSIMLIAAVAVAAAVAYLTSTQTLDNNFSVGEVEVELWEAFDQNDDGEVTGLTVNNDSYEYDNTDTTDEVYGPGEDFETIEHIKPGTEVTKSPFLENTGTNDAYVYLWTAFPLLDTGFTDPETGENRDEVYELFEVYHYQRDESGNIVYDSDGNPILLEGYSDNWEIMETVYPNSSKLASDKTAVSPFTYATSSVQVYSKNLKYVLLGYKETLDVGEQTIPPFDVVKLKSEITQDYFERIANSDDYRLLYTTDSLTGMPYVTSKGDFTDLDDEYLTEYTDINFIIKFNSVAIQAQIDELNTPAYDDDGNEIPLYQRAWDLYAEEENLNYASDYDFVIILNDEEYYYLNADDTFTVPAITDSTDGYVFKPHAYSTTLTDTNISDYTVHAGDVLNLSDYKQTDVTGLVTVYDLNSVYLTSSENAEVIFVYPDETVEKQEKTGGTTVTLPDLPDGYTCWMTWVPTYNYFGTTTTHPESFFVASEEQLLLHVNDMLNNSSGTYGTTFYSAGDTVTLEAGSILFCTPATEINKNALSLHVNVLFAMTNASALSHTYDFDDCLVYGDKTVGETIIAPPIDFTTNSNYVWVKVSPLASGTLTDSIGNGFYAKKYLTADGTETSDISEAAYYYPGETITVTEALSSFRLNTYVAVQKTW